MEVSVMSDFTDTELNKISLNKTSLNEIEDGELVEDSNSINTEEEKKILRAKRFGPVDNVSTSKIQDPKLQRLYRRMNVNSDTRLEALHLYGTDRMKTEDVFALFFGYTPASIEWLTDKTCNAVWLDQETCAEALKHCTVKIKGQLREESNDSEEEFIDKKDIRCALPPGGIWRRSQATQLAPNLLIRFATYSDRRGNKPNHLQFNDPNRKKFVFLDEGDEVAKKFRIDTGNPWVDIAREWSYFEMKTAAKKQDDRLPVRDARELISKSGRIPSTAGIYTNSNVCNDYENDYIDDDDGLKTTRNDEIILGRKMQADIEEKKILSKKLKLKYQKSFLNVDLRQRLSNKRTKLSLDGGSSDDELWEEIRNRKRDRNRRKRHLEDSWMRKESEDESEVKDDQSDNNDDLRRKLGGNNAESSTGKKKSTILTQNTKKFIPDTPLQIEIDNDIYFQRLNNNS